MIETSYYKDFRHNYLIIKGSHLHADMYQRRMITDNQIEGLLPCQLRHVNGETLLYYEVTSKQSLFSLYENGRITMKQLNKLFVQLKIVWERVSKYLLDESNLVLKPEFIFADVETEELTFLYYPFETEEDYMTSLLEFLADRVDSEDRDAAEIVYKMLELVTKEQFVLDEVLLWFEEDDTYSEPVENLQQEPERSEELPPVSESFRDQEERERMIGKAACFGSVLAVILEAVLFYVDSAYRLSEKLQIFLYAGFFLAGLLFLFCAGVLLYQKFIDKGNVLRNKTSVFGKKEERQEEPYMDTAVCEQIQEKADQAYGNTIFIPWVENCENKLYGVGKGNKNHIDLNRLPLTVGKLAGSVDMVIEDQSISRRHAKFFREGNRIFMSDLNSTNGSFKNGLRLLPNSSEVLEPGDEIRLGKLKFIYR